MRSNELAILKAVIDLKNELNRPPNMTEIAERTRQNVSSVWYSVRKMRADGLLRLVVIRGRRGIVLADACPCCSRRWARSHAVVYGMDVVKKP